MVDFTFKIASSNIWFMLFSIKCFWNINVWRIWRRSSTLICLFIQNIRLKIRWFYKWWI